MIDTQAILEAPECHTRLDLFLAKLGLKKLRPTKDEIIAQFEESAGKINAERVKNGEEPILF